jgi:hypothetical protein
MMAGLILDDRQVCIEGQEGLAAVGEVGPEIVGGDDAGQVLPSDLGE